MGPNLAITDTGTSTDLTHSHDRLREGNSSRCTRLPCSSPGWCPLGSRTGQRVTGSSPNQFMNLQGYGTRNLNNAVQGYKSCFVLKSALQSGSRSVGTISGAENHPEPSLAMWGLQPSLPGSRVNQPWARRSHCTTEALCVHWARSTFLQLHNEKHQ